MCQDRQGQVNRSQLRLCPVASRWWSKNNLHVHQRRYSTAKRKFSVHSDGCMVLREIAKKKSWISCTRYDTVQARAFVSVTYLNLLIKLTQEYFLILLKIITLIKIKNKCFSTWTFTHCFGSSPSHRVLHFVFN